MPTFPKLTDEQRRIVLGDARVTDLPASYEEGWNAFLDAVELTDNDAPDEPPEHLTAGMSARRRDGFRGGWNDAMVAAEE